MLISSFVRNRVFRHSREGGKPESVDKNLASRLRGKDVSAVVDRNSTAALYHRCFYSEFKARKIDLFFLNAATNCLKALS